MLNDEFNWKFKCGFSLFDLKALKKIYHLKNFYNSPEKNHN